MTLQRECNVLKVAGEKVKNEKKGDEKRGTKREKRRKRKDAEQSLEQPQRNFNTASYTVKAKEKGSLKFYDNCRLLLFIC